MAINYYKAHSTEFPAPVDLTSSPNGVYLRKNVQEITQQDQDEQEQTLYEYDEAYLTMEEFKTYSDVDNLTMTALDFITALENAGVNYADIQAYLNEHTEVDKQLKYCQNVYCGVVKKLLPITLGNKTITAEIVERAFLLKNGII